MSSSPRRHLDFWHKDVSSGGVLPSDDCRRRSEHESAPQHPSQQNSTNYAESARHRVRRSPFSPRTPSSPPIRNSLSSHASDMGRRLAQERSKNQELMQQMQELERTVSLLKQHGNTIDAPPCFSSPPVSLPKRGGKVHSSEENDLPCMGYEQRPEETLHHESQGQNIAGTKAVHLFEHSELTGDPSIVRLLEQASKLLSKNNVRPGNMNGNTNATEVVCDTTKSESAFQQTMYHGGSAGPTQTEERMHEYNELVSAFHAEHESHGDIDGEEFISREDTLWLFQELKLRFEDILSIYANERSKKKDESTPVNEEWKECLGGLTNVVKKAIRPSTSFHQKNVYQWGEHTNGPTLVDDGHVLRREVSSLNQRLASFAAQHKETCRSLYDDMEAMKRDYQEQLANKTHCIQNLETKISEQEQYIAQMQKEVQKEERWIQEEKQTLKLSKEGTSVRIHYLEGMLRSLQVELKETRTHQGNKCGASNSTPVRSEDARGDEERENISPPVFMRNLTSAMQDAEAAQCEDKSTDEVPNYQAKEGGGTHDALIKPSDDAEMAKLRDQIAQLGSSLADSENQRAKLLDDFQAERNKFILQYKHMSDILKHLIQKERKNNTEDSVS